MSINDAKKIIWETKRNQRTFEIFFIVLITTYFVNLTPIYGEIYIPPNTEHKTFKWIRILSYLLFAWGDRHSKSQNTTFFSPLWYENKFALITGILFIAPFMTHGIAALKYLLLNGGCKYECKKRCGSAARVGVAVSVAQNAAKKPPKKKSLI